jgi:hypothetical protein
MRAIFLRALGAVYLVLCPSLVEDRDWERGWAWFRRGNPDQVAPALTPEPRWPDWLRRALLGSAAGAIVVVRTMEGLDRAGWTVAVLRPFEPLRNGVAPFLSMDAYGLFAVMTTDRPEIIVEGSRAGVTWVPYDFRRKPGDVRRRPRFTTPHMPRLDWQMWFAARSRDCRSQPLVGFHNLVERPWPRSTRGLRTGLCPKSRTRPLVVS